MLEITDVKKNYSTFTLECSLKVRPGMITGLIGANGAGKSTTFKAVLNLFPIDAGQITVFGKAHTALTPRDKEKIGVVLADSGFSEYLTIKDVAAIMKYMYQEFNESDFLGKCQKFNLPLKKKIKEFSTGMNAKLKLLAAMSHGAELLILDEPTLGLDVMAREELLALLQDYLEEKEGRAVLISSHISGDLEKFCDDIYMIHEGQIVLHEEVGTLLDDYGVLKVEDARYPAIDKTWLLRQKKESFGYSLLTSQRQFYLENYPDIIVEKSSIDDVILMMTIVSNDL